MLFKYSMTIPQHLEYERLKKENPSMSQKDLFVAITGSFLCLGKSLFNQFGFADIAKVFLNCSKTFFWILIIVNIVKGIEKTHKSKTRFAGITQLIGSGISTLFMLR